MRIRVAYLQSGITLSITQCTWGWWPVAGGKRPEAQALRLSFSASEAGRRGPSTNANGRRRNGRETHSEPSCAHGRAVARHDEPGALAVPA